MTSAFTCKNLHFQNHTMITYSWFLDLFSLGGVYSVLGNLEPKYRSVTRCIQLICLCPVRHIQSYGIDKILERFMNDLHHLELVSTAPSSALLLDCKGF